MNHLRYLSYVVRHKWFVFVAGFATGAPLWRLVIHDWSKFTPAEWGPYVRKFYGNADNRTPLADFHGDQRMWALGCWWVKWKEQVDADFDRAWLHHQHTNPHHWQHWVLREDSGATKVLEMPEHFVREMVADWMGAGRAITGKWEAQDWYIQNASKMLLHDRTRDLVERLL